MYEHGADSFDLADEPAVMRADGWLRLRARVDRYGPTPELTERGTSLATECAELTTASLEFIAKRFGSKNVKELERLATAFLASQEMPAERAAQQRAERLHELKPHVSMLRAAETIREADYVGC